MSKQVPANIASTVTVKKLKLNFGHDGGGMSCDVYFNGKKFADLYDDGWGGDTRMYVHRTTAAEIAAASKEVEDFLRTNRFDQFLCDNSDYDFPQTPEGKTLCDMLDAIAMYHAEQAEVLKFAKKREKEMLTKVLAGDPKKPDSYRFWDFRAPLANVSADVLKRQIDIIKTKLQPGEVILNTNLSHVL